MNEKVEMEQATDNWKVKTLIAGALIGTLIGIGAAYLLVQKAEKVNDRVSVTAGEGIKLGLTVLGLLRQVTQLGDGG